MCCTIKFIEKLNFLCVLILLNRGKIKFTSLVEVMKRAASCKYRQAVKTIQCEKSCSILTYILLKLGERVEKHATSTYQKMAARMKSLLVR